MPCFENCRQQTVHGETQTYSHLSFGGLWEKACLTFDLASRSKVIAPNESLYMIYYMSTIQMAPLFLIVFEKTADFNFFDL